MQETQVQSPSQEDPTCRGASKPMYLCSRALESQLLKAVRLRAMPRSKRSHGNEKPMTCDKSSLHPLQLEKVRVQQQRSRTARSKEKITYFKKREKRMNSILKAP